MGIIFPARFLSLFQAFKTCFLGGTFSSLGCVSSPMPTESVEKLEFMSALLDLGHKSSVGKLDSALQCVGSTQLVISTAQQASDLLG